MKEVCFLKFVILNKLTKSDNDRVSKANHNVYKG